MLDYAIPALIIFVLILLNGLFVAAEFALVGVPRASIERLAAQGHRVARYIRRILHEPRRQDRYIATAQIGITFASLGLGMYGEHVLADRLAPVLGKLGAGGWIAEHALASAASVILLTYLHIVLGEMVPKSLALLHADRAAIWITPPMRWVYLAFFPLVASLNGISNAMLRVVGVRRQVSSGVYLTPEELEYVVRESAEGGLLQQDAGRVVRDLFEFGGRTAAEVMVPRVHVRGIPVDAPIEEILARVRPSRHTRYPVFDGDLDHIIGMIHIKDLFRLLRAGKTLRENGIRSLPYVPETSELDTVLSAMRQHQAQMVVVMDEHGGTAGIITLGDLFDEVLGEIEDEESGAPDIVKVAGDALRIAGTVRIDELGDALDVPLEHEDVDTVSGLVLALLDRPPLVGDVVTYQGFRLEVIDVEGHGVGACRVTRVETPSDPD